MRELTITPLALASVQLPEAHPEGPGPCLVQGFLICDGDERVLVDTGVGTDEPLIDRAYRPTVVAMEKALGRAGTRADEITAVVNSHLHFDHCGGNGLFPGVPIYVQQQELDAAQDRFYTVHRWFDFPGASIRPVEGDMNLTDRIRLLATPGHTPGHQSVVVEGEGGRDIVIAQAAYRASEFTATKTPGAGPISADAGCEREYRRSLARLHALAPRRGHLSHDARCWEAAPTGGEDPGRAG